MTRNVQLGMHRSGLTLALLALVATSCSSAPDDSAVPTVPPTIVAWPDELDDPPPAPTVGDDPLGLVVDGWSLSSRDLHEDWGVDDVYGCHEQIGLLARGSLSFVTEHYLHPDTAGVWTSISYLDYGDAEAAERRTSGYAVADAACAVDDTAGAAVVFSDSADDGTTVVGYVSDDQQAWVVVATDGRAVLFDGRGVSLDERLDLTDRALVWLGESSA